MFMVRSWSVEALEHMHIHRARAAEVIEAPHAPQESITRIRAPLVEVDGLAAIQEDIGDVARS